MAKPQAVGWVFRENRPAPVRALTFRAYRYRAKCEPGPRNANADAPSRHPLPEAEESAEELPECALTLRQLDETLLSSLRVRKLTAGDEIPETVRKYTIRG